MMKIPSGAAFLALMALLIGSVGSICSEIRCGT